MSENSHASTAVKTKVSGHQRSYVIPLSGALSSDFILLPCTSGRSEAILKVIKIMYVPVIQSTIN